MPTMEIKGISIDSRTIREGDLFIAIRGDRFDGHDFVAEALKKGACGALVERSMLEAKYATLGGVANVVPVEDTVFALQELAMMRRKKFFIPVVGITGSNGKTTTKEMLASILAKRGPVLKNEGNLNNHIGVPLTLFRLNSEHRSAVIEMGMSGLGEIEVLTHIAMPTVGVITNIGPAHLEFLRDTDTVARAKAELLAGLRGDGTAVLNADDRYYERLRAYFAGPLLSFGVNNPASVTAADIRTGGEGTFFTLRFGDRSAPVLLRTLGTHNVSNALAAAAAAFAVGLSIDDVREGLEAFRPVAMRSELKEKRGVTIVADYYNANPASMQAALEMLATLRKGTGRLIAVLGDMLELGETGPARHREIGRNAARLGIDHVITVGPLAEQIAAEAAASGMPKARAVHAGTTGRAAELLRELAKPGDTVLIKGSRGMKMESILEAF